MQILKINDYTNRKQIMSIEKIMWRSIFFYFKDFYFWLKQICTHC